MFDTKLSETRAPMKLSVTVIAKVLACLILFIWLPQTAEAARRVLLGVYEGDVPVLQAMESWQGKKHAVVNIFTSWCHDGTFIDNFFEVQLINLWENGNIPMITWKPSLGNPSDCYNAPSTPDDVEVQAADHAYDDYLHSWAEQLQTFLAGPDGVYGNDDDRRVYLRLAHEMNGDWYEWSGSPADYIRMWQHVKAILDSKTLDANHVQWVWSVNDTDYGGFDAEEYYPGDDYVDWVAIDGYNRGGSSWKTPHAVFNNMAGRLHALTTLTSTHPKPLAITEVGSTSTNRAETVGDVGAKARWITNFFNQAVKHDDVKMVLWFNEDKEDMDDTGQIILNDWAVFGGAYGDTTSTSYNVYTAYRTAVATNHFVSSNATNARLLTNGRFRGR